MIHTIDLQCNDQLQRTEGKQISLRNIGMKQLKDYSDERYKGSCPHCGKELASTPTNDDHIPSKAILDRPLPANVHVVETCMACNNGFSSRGVAAFTDAVFTDATLESSI